MKFPTKNLTEVEESAASYQTTTVLVRVWEHDCLETAMAAVYRHNCIKNITSDAYTDCYSSYPRLLILLEASSKVDLFKVGHMM